MPTSIAMARLGGGLPDTAASADRRRLGVTLVEMVLVLVIMACLSAIAVPRWANFSRRHRLDLAAKRIQQDVRLVRSQAIRDRTDRHIAFDSTLQRYQILELPGTKPSDTCYTITFDRSTGPVRLSSAVFGGSGQLGFNYLGIPSSSGTIVLSDGLLQTTLSISGTTGRATQTWP